MFAHTNLSNHPLFPNITRKWELKKIDFDEISGYIRLLLYITHFINNVAFTDMDGSVPIVLNGTKMYPDGQGGFIPDYTAFLMQAEAGASLKTMVQNGIAAVDADNTINNKFGYKALPTPITATAERTDVTTNGGNDGSINVTITGGVGTYVYSWSNGATTQNLSALAAGTYVCTISDESAYTDDFIITVVVTEPEPQV